VGKKKMTMELKILTWTLVLALFQVFAAAQMRTAETGLAWNMSARDSEGPPMRPITARLKRAQANLMETLPLFATAVLIAHVAGREGSNTLTGCWVYFLSRVLYVPLYAFGVPLVRSLVWVGGVCGLVMILYTILA
jgi:uncharacterized MAPEG superfamily protein